jgi:hypothetical protein
MKKIQRTVTVILVVLAMLAGPQSHGINTTLFFDDFVATGAPQQWSGTQSDIANSTQNGGYLGVTVREPWGASCCPIAVVRLIANQSSGPVLGPNTPDGQIVYMVFKVIPFNMSSTYPVGTSTHQRTAELDLTLRQAFGGVGRIGFRIVYNEGNKLIGGLPGLPRSSVLVAIDNPMPNTMSCMDANAMFIAVNQTCPQRYVSYEGTYSPLDLGAIHIFTMYGKFYPVSHTSWITFSVDNMASINITQAACNCIDSPLVGRTYVPMFPMIEAGYQDIVAVCPNTAICSQSVGAYFDYVLVDDYVPPTLPVGQAFLGYPGQIPTSNPQPFNGGSQTGDLPSYFVYAAAQIGQGNVYFGGFWITLGMLLLFVLPMGILGVRSTWIYAFTTGMVMAFNFFVGIIPLWAFLFSPFLIVGGVMSGVFGSHIGGMEPRGEE